jgi:hypothetical protein
MGFFSSFFGKEERSQEDINFENHVRRDGAQYAGKRLADIINEKITSKELAVQFILEELDAARQGNAFAKNFVNNSGFEPSQYMGAMKKTIWDGDPSKLEELQLFYRVFLVKIADIDLMVELSTVIVDNIMQIWKLGKYKNIPQLDSATKNHFNNLTQVDMRNKGLEDFPGVAAAEMINVTILKLGRNKLKELPEEIWNLSKLEELYLNKNNFTKISTKVERLQNLTGLYLAENHLNELPSQIGNLKNLRELYIAGNELRKLPKEIINLTSLTHFDFSENVNLSLTEEQNNWIMNLEKNGCEISR